MCNDHAAGSNSLGKSISTMTPALKRASFTFSKCVLAYLEPITQVKPSVDGISPRYVHESECHPILKKRNKYGSSYQGLIIGGGTE